jgi:1,4-dihydroxy-2-naphthoate octaprenyltransferase
VGKLPKLFWVLALGIAAGAQLGYGLVGGFTFSWLGPIGLIGIIAALVYLFGIRPEVIKYGGRRPGGRSSSEGPYGPW